MVNNLKQGKGAFIKNIDGINASKEM